MVKVSGGARAADLFASAATARLSRRAHPRRAWRITSGRSSSRARSSSVDRFRMYGSSRTSASAGPVRAPAARSRSKVLLAPRRRKEERKRVPALERDIHQAPPPRRSCALPARAGRDAPAPTSGRSSLPLRSRCGSLESVPLYPHRSGGSVGRPSAHDPIRLRSKPHNREPRARVALPAIEPPTPNGPRPRLVGHLSRWRWSSNSRTPEEEDTPNRSSGKVLCIAHPPDSPRCLQIGHAGVSEEVALRAGTRTVLLRARSGEHVTIVLTSRFVPGQPPRRAKVGQKFRRPISHRKHKGPVSGAFEVAGAGFEPATSGL